MAIMPSTTINKMPCKRMLMDKLLNFTPNSPGWLTGLLTPVSSNKFENRFMMNPSGRNYLATAKAGLQLGVFNEKVS